ncbi:MAG: DUF4892 domain-containing protein [Chromatocurvus sp.]
MPFASVIRLTTCLFLACLLSSGTLRAQEAPLELFDWLEMSPFAERVDQSERQVRAHLIGLGRIKKVRGTWNPETLERVNGRLLSTTWQIIDGASSAAIFREVVSIIEERDDARLLFSCTARECGASVQWANMVFGQRILYGTESSQHYRAYALGPEGASTHRVLVYSSARSSDRQYLHAEIVVLAPGGPLDFELQQ